MTDYCLKFQDEARALAALFTTQEGEGAVTVPIYPNTDTIGVISRNVGTPEEPVYKVLEGWHVNVRTAEPAPELDAYAVFPVAPVRVWG